MAAPFPYEALEGATTDEAENEAKELYIHYAWMAKWSDRMAKDADLDLKKLVQFISHCHWFRRAHDALTTRGTAALDIIEGVLLMKRLRFKDRATMVAVLNRLYQRAGEELRWFQAAMAAYKTGFAVMKFDDNWNRTDEPVRIEKTAEAASRIAAFRAEFDGQ